MGTLKQYFNRKSLLEEIKKRTGYDIGYVTMWEKEKSGIFSPSGYMKDGTRDVPVYEEDKLQEIINTLEQMKKEGRVRIKIINVDQKQKTQG